MTELESLVTELKLFSLAHKTPSPFDNACALIYDTLKITEHQLISKRKKGDVVDARQIAMFLLCDSEYTLKEIGNLFGNRDHSTVIHARDKIENTTKASDPKLYNKLKLFGIK